MCGGRRNSLGTVELGIQQRFDIHAAHFGKDLRPESFCSIFTTQIQLGHVLPHAIPHQQGVCHLRGLHLLVRQRWFVGLRRRIISVKVEYLF